LAVSPQLLLLLLLLLLLFQGPFSPNLEGTGARASHHFRICILWPVLLSCHNFSKFIHLSPAKLYIAREIN
jgi:hypothetical protein